MISCKWLPLAAFLWASLGSFGSAQQTPAYKDLHASFEKRADDLLSRMTLEEKVSQMQDDSPAIKRLGVPAYGWWNEALHGVARSGIATSFPQAIGLAAIWDDDADASGWRPPSRRGAGEVPGLPPPQRLTDCYQGLTFWSPNINLFRDPRWGRGKETYGEDPYLTGRMAVQFIRGLQGDDPEVPEDSRTVKHYAVHSGPEPERHIRAFVGERDLRESYLPQFEAGIRERGRRRSLMCAYNSLYGEPACANSTAPRKDPTRRSGDSSGYVVSDCDAIQRHLPGTTSSPPARGGRGRRGVPDWHRPELRRGLRASDRRGAPGPDFRVGDSTPAVTRLFLARFRLGMFDPPDMVRYAQSPMSDQ